MACVTVLECRAHGTKFMADTTSHRHIQRLVDRLARRIRVQRAIDGLVTGASLSVMVALVALTLLKTGWLAADSFWLALGGSAVFPIGFAAWGWLRRLDSIALAQRLDRTHSLHDRLSTALALGDAGPANDFERAQIEDALRYLDGVKLAPAAPFHRPTDLVPLVGLFLAVAAVAVLQPPNRSGTLPTPPEIENAEILDEATVALERDRLEKIRDQLEGLNDPESMELVEEIEKLLEQVEEREISEREFLDRLEELEEKYFDAESEAQLARLTDKLKEAAEKLEQEAAKDLAQEEEVKEIVDALKREDLDGASKALQKLAEKLASGEMSEKQLERIAKLMEKFADKIDPNDPALQKLMEKNRDLIEKLSKKMESDGGLGEEEKQRLKRAQEELKKQQEQQQKQENSESSRELQKIRRQSRELSERATAESQREDAIQPKKGKEEKGKDGDKGENGQKGEQGEKEEQRYENEASRKAREASESMKKKAEQKQIDEAKQQAREQLRDLKESMQRSSRQAGESQQDDSRGEDMKEFLRRAKGKTDSSDGVNEEGKGKGDVRGGEGKSESGEETKSINEGETNIAGKGKGNRELGEETSLDGKRTDVKVEAEAGKGPSRSEIIRAASEGGFATTEYKEVYADYESVVEEVMEKEKIPSGYRYYIERYFQLIQPQE